MFAFVFSLLQHIGIATASIMAEGLSYGSVTGHVGVTAMVLAWIAPVRCSLVAGTLGLMSEYLSTLERLLESTSADGVR